MVFRRRQVRTLGFPIQSQLLGDKVIGAIRIQIILAVVVTINLIGLTIAAYMILRKK
jgi:hypothetical protein